MLPTTMPELHAFPQWAQKPIFSKLPAETKASLWQEQLAAFSTSRTLTAEQRDFVDAARSRFKCRLLPP
jgi:hypothetical protein